MDPGGDFRRTLGVGVGVILQSFDWWKSAAWRICLWPLGQRVTVTRLNIGIGLVNDGAHRLPLNEPWSFVENALEDNPITRRICL